jgi:zeaxanthin epoxidase
MRAMLLVVAASPVAALSLGGLAPRAAVPSRAAAVQATVSSPPPTTQAAASAGRSNTISKEEPLHVLIAGAGVGGLALANYLHFAAERGKPVTYTVLERTTQFKRFGGPIQLASNALREFQAIDPQLYSEVEACATWTGNRTNGIKDGVRDEWYARFDLKTPAEVSGFISRVWAPASALAPFRYSALSLFCSAITLISPLSP